ncbi:MAG TPA: hypothetical protein VEU54_00945 [Steroidobacteraceae bacterium]|nr:hypothetical protein [Steroidobacteraceae bacterium]
MKRGLSGASGAENLCAFDAIGRFCAAAQLHRWTAPVMSAQLSPFDGN